MVLLSHGGMLPRYQTDATPQEASPRRKGVKQGALLFLLGALLVPLFGVMSGFAPGRLENVFLFFCAASAIICFLGGPLRMLFAALFEEGAPPRPFTMAPQSYAPPAMTGPPPPFARISAVPPQSVNPTTEWRRTNTAEIAQPPSVTDSTTQLLGKREPEGE